MLFSKLVLLSLIMEDNNCKKSKFFYYKIYVKLLKSLVKL